MQTRIDVSLPFRVASPTPWEPHLEQSTKTGYRVQYFCNAEICSLFMKVIRMSDSNEIKEPFSVLVAGTLPATTSVTFSIRGSVDRVLETFDRQLSAQSITLSVDISAELRFAVDESLFERAVRCLCEQSVHGMPNGGELVITAVVQDQGIELEIADSRRDYIKYPRLFGRQKDQISTDTLIPVHYFATAHGGFVRAHNCPEGGVAFTIHLPFPKALRSAA